MAIGTPWVGTTYASTTAETSATVDISGATTGEVVYIFWGLGKSQTSAVTCTGWTSILDGDEGTSSHYAILRRVKQAGDTTFTINWPTSGKAIFVPVSWPGVNTSTPEEQVGVALHTSAGTTYTTQSATPTSNDRWAVTWTCGRGSTAAYTFTPDAALTERADWGDASSVFIYGEVADSAGAVTQASHSYTATASGTDSHGFAALFYLIPSSSGMSVTGNLSGSGTLTAPCTPNETTTASLSGSGTLIASETPGMACSAALSGSGTLGATAIGTQAGAVDALLVGEGVLTAGNLIAQHYRYFFTPPTWQYGERHGHKGSAELSLFSRLKYDKIGYTVLKTNGFYTQVVDPDSEQCSAADVTYLGGHVYEITPDEATSLTNAGYGANITQGYF